MLCYAMLCYAMLCYAMLCYAMLCYAMLCYAMLCYGDAQRLRQRQTRTLTRGGRYIVLAGPPGEGTSAVCGLQMKIDFGAANMRQTIWPFRASRSNPIAGACAIGRMDLRHALIRHVKRAQSRRRALGSATRTPCAN